MSEIVAIIPCREGSKRLLNKNKKILCSKPLFCWTIDLALEIAFFDKIIVSTDDEDILQLCHERYNNFDKLYLLKRSKELANDSTPIWKVVKDVFDKRLINKKTIIAILQVTSPLRSREDIGISMYMFLNNDMGIVSVCKKDKKTYKRNGAIYIDWYNNWIRNKTVDGQYYLMPKERSVDIDTIEDWNLAEKIMRERLKQKEKNI